jgi:hypothetical protein
MTHRDKMRNVYRIVVERPEAKKHLGDLGVDGRYTEHIHGIRHNRDNSDCAKQILDTQHEYGKT